MPLGMTIMVAAWPPLGEWTCAERLGARWGSVRVDRTPAVLPARNGRLKRSTRVPTCLVRVSPWPFVTAITATTATTRKTAQVSPACTRRALTYCPIHNGRAGMCGWAHRCSIAAASVIGGACPAWNSIECQRLNSRRRLARLRAQRITRSLRLHIFPMLPMNLREPGEPEGTAR